MKRNILQILLSGALTFILVDFLKNIFRVPRPENALIKLNDYAFPSGHASVSFSIAIVLVYIIIKSCLKRDNKFLMSVVVFCGAGYIAYTRLLLQVHTVDQILIGSLVASIIIFITNKINVHN